MPSLLSLFPVSDGRRTTVIVIRLLMIASLGCFPAAVTLAVIRHFVLKTWLHQTLQIVLSTVMTVLCFVAGKDNEMLEMNRNSFKSSQ